MKVLTTTEQRTRARVVLLAAADFYRARRGSLLACIGLAAKSSLDSLFTQRVLRGVLWERDLAGWEAHPMRRRAEVWRALKLAIRWCSRRVGGWSVAGIERTARADVSPDRQHLEWLPRRA